MHSDVALLAKVTEHAKTKTHPRGGAEPLAQRQVNTMKLFILATAICGLVAIPATSAYGDQPLSAAARQAQIERVRDGLNSPDPTKRLVTLEQAVDSKDASVRLVAISTALASSDPDLRVAALAASIRSAATFVVDITDKDPSNKTHAVTSRVGSSLQVRIRNYDRSRNVFETTASTSKAAWLTGGISGDRFSFAVSTEKVFPTGSERSLCRGVTRLQSSGAVLKGTMNCLVGCEGLCNDVSENYAISIDVPK